MKKKILSNEEFLKLNVRSSNEQFPNQFTIFKTIIENEKSKEKLEVVNKIINENIECSPAEERVGTCRDYYTGDETDGTYTYTLPEYYYFHYTIEKFMPYLEKLAHKYEVQNYAKKDREKIAILEEETPER